MPDPELRGIKVLVTRPAAQAQRLCDGIQRLGGEPVALPLLEIEPLHPSHLPDLAVFGVLIFVSANAVRYGLDSLLPLPAGMSVGAIGRATAEHLAAAGVRADLVPTRYDSEGLLALPGMQHLHGKSVLIVRGQGGRETLAESLRARGAQVAYLEVYRRVCPVWDAAAVQNALGTDIISVTSAEAVENLAQLARQPGAERLWAKPLMVYHERIAGRARELGFTLKPVVTDEPGDDALLTALLQWVDEQKGMGQA